MIETGTVLRTIRQEPLFQEQLEAIEPDVRRADEFLRGVEWLLARNPTFGQQVAPNSKVWAVASNEAPTIPNLIVYYTFDENMVYLLHIVAAEEEP